MKNKIKIIKKNILWVILILVGIVLICYGIANIIDFKTLQVKDIVKIVASFVIGFTTIVISINQMQKKILEMLIEKSDTREKKNNTNTLIFNKKVYNQGPKIVVIGGGSGLNTVLRGLKNYTDNITAIVTVSDYGEIETDSKKSLELLPIDDIKESIVALAKNENAMEALLNQKFEKGKLKNFSFGDIYFAAMNEVCGGFLNSIEQSKEIFNITGKVLPVTLEKINICAELEDGTVIESKDKIPEVVGETTSKISRIYIRPTNCMPAPGVIDAIKEADAIVIGPGSLYTNVIPNLLVNGVTRAIKESKAIRVYVSNIMTELGQTDDFKLSDHISTIQDYLGKDIIDYVIYDTGEIVPEFVKKYNLKGSDVVLPDTQKAKELGVKLIQRNLSMIDGENVRHNPDVIASTIIQLVCDELAFEDKENDSQFMSLNSKLKESKREIKKREKAEKKFRESGKKQFERKEGKSKFANKYRDRVEAIRESESLTQRNREELEKKEEKEGKHKWKNGLLQMVLGDLPHQPILMGWTQEDITDFW